MKEKYFKLDQDVWYMGKIKGKVVEIGIEDEMYPIVVLFDDGTGSTFTHEGKLGEDNDYISLFQKPFEFPKNEPFFQERPAYFWNPIDKIWIYDIHIGMSVSGQAVSRNTSYFYDKWQYHAPDHNL